MGDVGLREEEEEEGEDEEEKDPEAVCKGPE